MSSSTMIEVFGHIVFNVTRGVTEHYNPQEPEFTAKCFDYNLLESLGYVGFSTNFAATQLWVLNDSRRRLLRRKKQTDAESQESIKQSIT